MSAFFWYGHASWHLHTGLCAIGAMALEPGRRNTVTEVLANHHPLHDGNIVFMNDTYTNIQYHICCKMYTHDYILHDDIIDYCTSIE